MEYDIKLENVTFTYKGAKDPAIKGINLEVKKGEFLMITGPAGAGKTTLCCCLNGLIPHFYEGTLEGKVLVKGNDTKKFSIAYLSTIVGLLFQDPSSQLICPTIEDEIAFGAENYCIPTEEINNRVNECMKILRLEKYSGRSPYSLSGGEQQAVALAAIMAMRPSIYVLDEPTSNLDPVESLQVLRAIKDLATMEQKSVIIVEHKMEELVPVVDRMVVLDKGQILLDGPASEVLKKAEMMKEIGLKPPQVSLLFMKLNREKGIDLKVPLTVDEAYQILSKLLSEKRRSFNHTESGAHQGMRPHGAPVIRTEDLWFTYPQTSIPALRGISLMINEGEFVGIIGMNGSGKTTLVKHFNGLLKPTKGKAFVFGLDTKTAPSAQLARKVGFVFQNPDHQIFKNKVYDEVAFDPRNLGLSAEEIDKRVKSSLEKVACQHLIEANPFELSRGEKQRINIASVIAMGPELLVIDEPTTGQDFLRGRQIMELAKRMHDDGKTVVIISHDMNLIAEYVERVVVLKDG